MSAADQQVIPISDIDDPFSGEDTPAGALQGVLDASSGAEILVIPEGHLQATNSLGLQGKTLLPATVVLPPREFGEFTEFPNELKAQKGWGISMAEIKTTEKMREKYPYLNNPVARVITKSLWERFRTAPIGSFFWTPEQLEEILEAKCESEDIPFFGIEISGVLTLNRRSRDRDELNGQEKLSTIEYSFNDARPYFHVSPGRSGSGTMRFAVTLYEERKPIMDLFKVGAPIRTTQWHTLFLGGGNSGGDPDSPFGEIVDDQDETQDVPGGSVGTPRFQSGSGGDRQVASLVSLFEFLLRQEGLIGAVIQRTRAERQERSDNLRRGGSYRANRGGYNTPAAEGGEEDVFSRR